ncbi:sugar ABC transporter permease [Thiohalorhabdus denitrificans]|uniref:Multiple sugar transport system permease protein n=1 Tax=Thiohalorhabdus denitrificans TaxID=381306 RepID=A0A0P9EBR0_9GAMM|nr:carbohydrate ABC transporter permease [Thiohalorhabdus denitrificans]KPV39712.1 sugar ABC transporter permease [Thiohalorhabdus denitrificans]SCX92797.1 multiple sugar transport system permease protein [Thiohalorhabdus denitrificans]
MRRLRGGLQALLVYAVLAFLAAVYVAPIAFMVVGSLKPDARVLADMGSAAAFVPAEASLENYRDVFGRVSFGRFLFNSVLITGAIMLGGLLVNGFLGYALARLRWRGRGWVLAGLLALLILPLEAIAVPLFYQVTLLGWRDTYVVQILPFVAHAFFVYLFYVFFLGLPKELEEAARMDGASVLGTYFRIILPNAKPAFATVAILTFLFQWGQYLWPLMVTSGERVRPLPVAIAAFRTLPPLQWGDILAFGVMMVAPVIVVFLAFQRWFVRGVAESGLKG